MHPVIKIVNLVVVSIFLTQGGWATLLLTAALLLPFYLKNNKLWSPAVKMLYRLKWFFVSILFIYYYYTPFIQDTEIPILLQYLQQLTPGLFRISVLIFILFSVNLFIQTTTKEDILSALLFISSPLKLFNVKTERISLRAVLTLEYIEILSERLRKYKIPQQSHDNKKKKFVFFQLIQYSGIILREILEEADTTSGQAYTIESQPAPELFQYLFPLLLCLFFYLSLSYL